MQAISIPRALIALRRRSMRLTADLASVQRKMRKWRLLPHASQVALGSYKAILGNQIAEIGAALIEAGIALVRVGDLIDSTMTVQQRAALIGANRRGEPLPGQARFLDLIAAGLESPKGRRGRAQCGALFLLYAALSGATMHAENERQQRAQQAESESRIARRIAINGGHVFKAPLGIH
ncbi:hypothetical protein P3T18_005397 [Paraburkholderia sp. GAS199]|uniref:hypothetical protein n=1 Tax=Paraburkholderia sp. GAS199 TaxID=3035126 RepID=UPI003D25BDAE